jgi:hypothetical protein
VAVGDFTNNGISDLVVANTAHSTVSVLLGNGDGTFQPELKSVVGKGPQSVAVGDFDGDGTLDIVTVNQNDISVLLGTGKGTFGSAKTFSLPNVIANQAPQLPLAVAVGDLNHDGKLDLVVAAVAIFAGSPETQQKGYIDVLLGQGDGTFKVGSITPINSSLGFPLQAPDQGFYPLEIALADLNGDGNLDVVTCNMSLRTAYPGGSSISVLLGNGDGTFRETSDPYVGVNFVTSVAVGDFNNDHIPDLVVNGLVTPNAPEGFTTAVSVLLGNGDGTFQPPQILTVPGEQVQPVAVADFNRDGNLDIVKPNGIPDLFAGTVSVFLGNGNGTFQAPLNFPSGANLSGAVALGDFNRDGFPDLAIADVQSNSVEVLVNSGSWGTAATTTSAPAPALAVAGSFSGSLGTALIAPALPPQVAPPGTEVAARDYLVAELAQEGQLDSALPLQDVTAWSGINGPRPSFKKIVHKGRSGPVGRSGPGLAQPSFRLWARSRAWPWDRSSTGLTRRAFGTNQADE